MSISKPHRVPIKVDTTISGTNIAPAQLLLSRICKTKFPIKDEYY